MLGTLAIVGVLSIGGIAGYQYAMNKHRANTILHTVSEMAVTGAGQLLGGNELTLTEFGTHIDGTYEFGFNGDYSGTETDFSIIVYDIPQAVCQHIQNSEFTMPYLRLMNDSDNGTCDEGMNTAEFVFWDNLNKKCSGGYTGDNCEEKIVCEHGTWTPQGCECDEGWYGKTCYSDCNGFENDTGSTCLACDSVSSIISTEEECARCSEREMFYGYNNQARCVLKECPADKPIRSNLGVCNSCTSSSSALGHVTQELCQTCQGYGVPRYSAVNTAGVPICYRCDYGSPIGGTTVPTVYCDMCDGTDYPRFMGADGKCYSCQVTTYAGSFSVAVDSKAECDICGSLRTYDATTGICKKN